MAASPKPPFVVTLDAGSSSVRALAFDARGTSLGIEHQQKYEPTTTPDGGVEYDADALVGFAGDMLDALLRDLGPRVGDVAAVAVSTFWHTLVGVDGDGRARTPVYSWADTRSAAAAEALGARLDGKAYHGRTGCMVHTSYLPARLSWLATLDPAGF